MTRSSALLDRELAGLLADLAESPDFAAAESLLLKQFSEAAGTSRAALYVVDPTFRRLEPRGSQGIVTNGAQRASIPLDDEGHPMTVAALGHDVVVCRNGALADLPFENAVLLPLPQARYRGGPQSYAGRSWSLASRFSGSAVFDWPSGASERRRRLGHVVFGVLVLEGRPHDTTVQELAEAALLTGPVIARSHALEGLGRTAERLDDERNLLTAIISALPDPIVITDSANRVVVQNQRADLLLSMRDDDSEGRRRAVEINNLLFSSFLSRAALAGGVRRS